EQFTKTIENMSKALTSSNMRNLVRSISRAIGNVGSSWAKSLNSPGFRAWLKAMDKTLPGQIETLGSIGENFGKTMGNVFLAMQPMIDRFLGWLDRVTEGWARMSATADG